MRQFMHSFDGTDAPPEILAGLQAGRIRAICLFAHRNVSDPVQVRALTDSLRAAAQAGGHPSPIIGIDQEGGQLIAISGGATELPGNMALGATRSPELAQQAGRVLARDLLAMGINMNFAPALDVNNNPANPVIGTRSFGDSPQQVAELGTAVIKGLQAEGVIATAKHFPGHGDTTSDSHYGTPIVAHTLERLNAVELLPFRAAIKAQVGAIMTAHIQFSALDDQFPATLSRKILVDLLRGKLGYDGLLITDAMDMHAVAHLGADLAVRSAIEAGSDVILLGHLPDQIGLADRHREAENPQAIARIIRAQQAIPATLPDVSTVGCADYRATAQTIADQSITLIRDREQYLPLRPAPEDQITVITVTPDDLTPADTSSTVQIKLFDAIKKRHAHVTHVTIPHQPDAEQIRQALNTADGAQTVIVGTIAADQFSGQGELVRALIDAGHTVIAVALRTPYDILAYPDVAAYLCAYGIRSATTEAVARVLFGEITARGVLPCAIPGIGQDVAL